MGSQPALRTAQKPEKSADGFKGEQIILELLGIGKSGIVTGTVEQQPQHQGAVKAEKQRPYAFFHHKNHIQSILEL